MGFNYFTKPGEILKEYIDERGITQKELAMKTNSSEKHISEIINAKAKITIDFALKLEEVFPDVDAKYWLNLENEYQLFLVKNYDEEIENSKKIVQDYKLKTLFKGMDYNENKMVKEMLKIVGEPNVNALEYKIKENKEYLYMHDGGNDKTIYLWLKLCEEQIEIQNDAEIFPKYDHGLFFKNHKIIKKLLNTTNYKMALDNVRLFLNKHGIGLVIEEALPTSMIRGAVTIIDNHPMIYLSLRYKRLDSIYFALIHEIIHIINKDYENTRYSLTYEKDEKEVISNDMSREFFVNEKDYTNFIKLNKFSQEDIIIFAKNQGVIVDVIVGFLQRDGYLEYSEMSYLRTYVESEGDT